MRRRIDFIAQRIVTGGGVLIIAAILAILVVIAAEVLPLFKAPKAQLVPPMPAFAPDAFSIGVDEYLEMAALVTPDGATLKSIERGTTVTGIAIRVVATAGDPSAFAVSSSDGQIQTYTVKYDTAYANNQRTVAARLDGGMSLTDPPLPQPAALLAYALTPEGPLAVAATSSNIVSVFALLESTSLMGDVTREPARAEVKIPTRGRITALAVDHRGEHVVVGTSAGEIHVVRVTDRTEPKLVSIPTPVTGGKPADITLLGLLLGDRSLVVGDAEGRVSTWQLLQRGKDLRLLPLRTFEPHPGPVIGFARSERNKSFVTSDASGQLAVRYGTTGRTLIRLQLPKPSHVLAFSPKADALISVDREGTLHRWRLDNPHPEITLSALFAKTPYEGYAQPEQVWQSTGGTDDFESKFSLTPLIFGTLKGTLYAMLFAIPLSLLSALYVSQFLHPRLKQWIKSTVELMAALPSVVLGFIAALWLAPVMERHIPGLLILPFAVALAILVAMGLRRALPGRLRLTIRPGWEILMIAPAVLIGCALAFALGGSFESFALGGDYRHWLRESLGLTFDQRNSMVVGLAMGFAVVPIIFTIAEDALSSVPHHLKAASLALGATPWQTALRVILPTASPGIFSAVMIGLGRAVGETMIVLMATGNTPIMDWSIFNGFRAMSANIAVELPEAPVGSTLFRVLFLAALLLYLLTFTLNTVAELVRLRLRNKYRVI